MKDHEINGPYRSNDTHRKNDTKNKNTYCHLTVFSVEEPGYYGGASDWVDHISSGCCINYFTLDHDRWLEHVEKCVREWLRNSTHSKDVDDIIIAYLM